MFRRILKALALSVTLGAAWSAGAHARETIEQLDAAANLLMTVADSDQPGACGIAPSEARRLLMAIHPVLDEKRNATIAALSSRFPGKSIASPKWDQTCFRKCHCGLYASILEGVGEERLVPSDRALLDRMNGKARRMSGERLKACVKASSSWFCKSDLLARLKKEARGYPDPLATKRGG
jgi:hypothetical protein